MTRTVEDCALVLNAIVGYDPKDPRSSKAPVPDYTEVLTGNVKGLRIGVIKEFDFRTRGPVLGWTSAIAAYGAFIIPIVFKGAIERTDAPDQGLYGFCVFYAVSMVILWWFYLRKSSPEHGA